MRTQLIVLSLTLALAGLACGQPGPAAQQSGSGAASSAPRSGGVISVNFTADPANWDLTYTGNNLPHQQASELARSSLLRFKTGPDVPYDELTLEPALAERWEVSSDAKTYTYTLRKGVKWPNIAPLNGREFTADDVKWSYEYYSRTGWARDKGLPPANLGGTFFEGLESVEAPDPYTVVVKFKNPFVPFLNYSASANNPIFPHEIYDRDGSFKDQILGTGPFQLDMSASQQGTRFVWKKNPNYWEPGRPYIDEVRTLILPDPPAGFAAFKTKQLDMLTYRMTDKDVAQVTRDNPDAVVYSYLENPLNLYMNVRRPPLSDIRVRQAISLALDRDEFVQTFAPGKGAWALAGTFPDTFTQDEIHQILKYDPEQAKRLLAEAGYGNGLEMEHLYPGLAFGQAYIDEMQLFQAQLKKVGINLTLKSMDIGDYLPRTRGNTYDLTLRGIAVEQDVDSYLYTSFHPKSAKDYNGVDDPKLTEMLEAQRREPDPVKRKEIVRQAARYIADQAWGLAVFAPSGYRVWQPYVKNYAPHFSYVGGGWPLYNTWLEK